jgi:predicted transcriptional regulator of viral defense system
MGKQIHLERVKELFEKSPVVDFKSIERVIGKSKKGNYAKLFVHNLIKKGEIRKIGKGFYTKYDDVSLSVFCFNPSYLGLQSALSFHGLWDQATIPIIITSKNARVGLRRVLGKNVFVRKINKQYLFGHDLKKEGDFYFPYSDLEKTFLDFVLFNEKLSEEVLVEIRKRINHLKLKKYLKYYPKNICNKSLKLLEVKENEN